HFAAHSRGKQDEALGIKDPGDEVGLQTHDLLQFGARSCEIGHKRAQQREIEMSFGVVRSEAYCLSERGSGFVGSMHRAQRVADIEVCARIVGRAAGRLSVTVERAVELAMV